jgi:hypothetical protein
VHQLFPRLRDGVPIAKPDGNPSSDFILKWQTAMDLLESVPAIQDAVANAQAAADAANAAAAAAQTAADNANTATAGAMAESSLVSSFIVAGSFTPPLISISSTGGVTIATHQRQYGDTTLNPTVSVTGTTISTTGVNPDVVRVYYNDPTRAGGAVTYLDTIDPAPPPVQGGNTHSVGAGTVPAAGTQDGNFIQPPGFVPIP